MASGKITGPIGRTIRAAKKRGLGALAIADTVRHKHGTALDRRTIDRWLKENGSKPAPKPKAPAPSDTAPPDVAAPEPLDELATLQAQARDLKERLDTQEMGPTARATMNRELRQTFASIRIAKEKSRRSADAEHADAAWMVLRLKRYHANNGGPLAEDDAGLPEAPRAAGG